MLLKAYLDESRHTPDNGPRCVVAGWAGTADMWAECEKHWMEALGTKRALHMRSLRWSKPNRFKALLERLGPIPERAGLMRVAGSMDHQDYEEIVRGTVSERALNPYMASVQKCLKAMLASMSMDQRLHVYFEQQDVYEHQVNLLHQAVFVERKSDPRIAGMTFLPKDECWCFQPSDYLAFHLSTKAIDPNSDKTILTRPIWGNGSGMGQHYSRENLKREVRLITKTLGAASLPRFGASRKRKTK